MKLLPDKEKLLRNFCAAPMGREISLRYWVGQRHRRVHGETKARKIASGLPSQVDYVPDARGVVGRQRCGRIKTRRLYSLRSCARMLSIRCAPVV